MPVAT